MLTIVAEILEFSKNYVDILPQRRVSFFEVNYKNLNDQCILHNLIIYNTYSSFFIQDMHT